MLFTNQGITATKAELVALVQCTSGRENHDGVGITIAGGKLLAQATNGHAAIYHHSAAIDGKGGTYAGDHEWQVSADALLRIAKSMNGKDEVLLVPNSKGILSTALIREIESGEAKVKIDLAGHVAQQLAIRISAKVPERPVSSDSPVGQVALDPRLLGLVAKCSRACGASGASRWTIPDDMGKPVYIEVDTASRLDEGSELSSWIVVVMPLDLSASTEEDCDASDAAPSRLRAEADRVARENAEKGLN